MIRSASITVVLLTATAAQAGIVVPPGLHHMVVAHSGFETAGFRTDLLMRSILGEVKLREICQNYRIGDGCKPRKTRNGRK